MQDNLEVRKFYS